MTDTAPSTQAAPVSTLAWSGAVAAYELADAAVRVIAAQEAADDTDRPDEWDAASSARDAALAALLNTRAPDAAAMVLKAKLVLQRDHVFYADESADDAATVSMWLADADARGFTVLYQDALALAGERGPIVDAQPEPFDPRAWLDEVETRTGSVIERTDAFGNVAFTGGDTDAANKALTGLRLAHQDAVQTVGGHRADERAS